MRNRPTAPLASYNLFRPNAEQFLHLAGAMQDYLEALQAVQDLFIECKFGREANTDPLKWWVRQCIRTARAAGWFDPEH